MLCFCGNFIESNNDNNLNLDKSTVYCDSCNKLQKIGICNSCGKENILNQLSECQDCVRDWNLGFENQ